MQPKGKLFTGVVVSTAMKDTVVVAVERLSRHPLYKKTVKRTKNFVAHSTLGDVAIGDHVELMETKPISKRKHFRLVRKIDK